MTTTGVRDGRTTDGRTDRGGGRIATDRIAGRTNAGRTNAGRTRVSEFLNLDFALRRRTDGWSTEERSIEVEVRFDDVVVGRGRNPIMWSFALIAAGFLLSTMLAAYFSLRSARRRKLALEERESREAREAMREIIEGKEARHAAWAGRCSGMEMPDGKICVGVVVVEEEDGVAEDEEEDEEDGADVEALVEVFVDKT